MTSNKIIPEAHPIPTHYPCIGKYELDLTRGCPVRCIYCGVKEEEKTTKLDISSIINRPITEDIRKKGIYLSPNSDPFSKQARENAHNILKKFLPERVPFLIITKNKIPTETTDLLAKYPEQVYTQISIARLDDELNRYIEPGAANLSDRLENIKNLHSVGINVTVILMPIYPEVDDIDENLSTLVSKCSEAGAKYLKAAYVVINPKDEQQVNLMRNNPILNRSWEQMTEYLKIHIGGGMTAPEYRRLQLYETLNELCASNNMKFQTCPILDPAVLKSVSIPICRTYIRRGGE
ncbi:MAG: radical SAM protein [Nanoarchaeota archaeon]|nr:radical SAM protein [Nanoarchaeota archaeon]MBU1604398.1 radical SAM protein [Nanoarchaeota archaeon]MBU2443259.1 radical SAM protein [Nanoarchaeota archaeon]